MRVHVRHQALSILVGLIASALLAGAAAAAEAQPITLKDTIPLHMEVTSPCSGEQILVSEDLKWIGHLSDIDPENRKLQLLHTNAANATATSLTTGETYRFVHASTSRDDFSGAPFVSTFIVHQQFLGLGTGDSFRLLIHLLLTVDANGEVRGDIQKVEIECLYK
jgi:hypothetical protein